MASRYWAAAFAIIVITAAVIVRVVAPAIGDAVWAFLSGLGACVIGEMLEDKRRKSAGQR